MPSHDEAFRGCARFLVTICRFMRLTLCSFAICLILAAVPAWAAQGETAIPAACALTDVGSGTVRSVTDGRSLILADGREVRLVGLDFGPRAAPGGEENSRPRAELMKLIGETVMLRHRQLQTDRYGRVVAH